MKLKGFTHRTRGVVAGLVIGGLLLTACGGESGGAGGKSGDIKVGAAAGLTGLCATDVTKKSMELAAKKINDKGGVSGRMIQLRVQDVGCTAATGLAAARKMIQDDVDAVVGYSLTTQNLAVSPEFQKAKLVSLLGTASTANNFENTKNPYNFVMNIPDDETAEHQVKFALEGLKAERIALLLDSTAFGKTYGQLVEGPIKSGGGEIVATEFVNPDANDMSAQITKILESDADAVLVALLTLPTVSLMYTELNKQAPTDRPKLIGAAALAGALGSSVPWESAKGTYVTYMTDGIYDPAAFQGDRKAWYDSVKSKQIPSDNAAQMHDALLVLAAAIEATKSTDGDKLSAWFKQLSNFSEWNGIKTISGPYSCAATHQCLHSQFVGQVDGDVVKKAIRFDD